MVTSAETLVGRIRSGKGVCCRKTEVAWDLTGNDAVDLLHRLSTNDLVSGPVPRVLGTVFTTEKGRIIDNSVIAVDEKGVRLIPHLPNSARLRAWIERYTITEDIHWSELSPTCIVGYIIGLRNHFVAESWGENKRGDGRGIRVAPLRFGPDGAVLAVADAGADEEYAELIRDLDIHEVVGPWADFVRIVSGIPGAGELLDLFTPLEVGLRGLVSFTKGCYIGQEVVARLDAYQKVPRELTGITLEAEPPAEPALPCMLLAGEGQVGYLTSLSPIFWEGRFHGLAVVRRETLESGLPVVVQWPGGGQPGTLTKGARLV
jgi:folate-binding protein YgfZ